MLGLARALADRGRLRRHIHVSTAYVAGRHHGHFREADLDLGQGFRNTYEQSKFAGEKAIVAAGGDLPLVVARPSIVVGDSRTGWTPVFNVIYWPLRAFSRGLMDEVPVDPDGFADIVSIDYVASALIALLELDEASGNVHLVAGSSALTNRELIELACRQFDRPPPRLVADSSSTPDQASVYLPYFGIEAILDDERAQALLGPLGIAAVAAPRLLRAHHRVRRTLQLGQARGDEAGRSAGDDSVLDGAHVGAAPRAVVQLTVKPARGAPPARCTARVRLPRPMPSCAGNRTRLARGSGLLRVQNR
jgi:hypothetical protein